MWVGDTAYRRPEKIPVFFEKLREMGVNTAMVHGDGNLQPLLQNHFPYYVENMVNRGLCLKFNSKVRDWDKFISDWTAGGRPESALVRDFCLDDPVWRGWARAEMERLVGKNMAQTPLAYDIRDELSTTLSANPFDYDFNPITLEKFRGWLRTQYADLASLNGEWQTEFHRWEDVRPFTTDEIKNRMAGGEAAPRGRPDWQKLQQLHFAPVAGMGSATRWNFSPWCDFRTYMDISLAEALSDLRAAAHARDAATPVGIEGTQMPSAFGGYDLSRLAEVLDWVEPYDIGKAREILGSFMPGRPILTTVFENDADPAGRRLWHLLLEGDRGCIIWWSEDCFDFKSEDYALTRKARALRPVLEEMTSPLANLFMRAERQYDPVWIHYSQPSIQVDWLIESTVDGSTWLRRFSSFEAEHNQMAKQRNAWLKLFQDRGYSPRFISSRQIEKGGLRAERTNGAALVLPGSLALSAAEAEEIREFAAVQPVKHAVISDGVAGLFDEHGKLRSTPALNPFMSMSPAETAVVIAVGGSVQRGPSNVTTYASERLKDGGVEKSSWIGRLAGLPAALVAVSAELKVRTHRYRLGKAELLAFERNVDYHMSEQLKQAGGNESLEKPVAVEAKLARFGHIYNLRDGLYLGRTDRLHFTLNPWRPSLFAVLTEKLPNNDALKYLTSALNEK